MKRDTTQDCLKKIGAEVLLSAEDEQMLLPQAVNGSKEAMDKIIDANRRFVVSVANQYQNRGLVLPELIAASEKGLINAVMESASRPRDERFIQFAVPYMRRAIEEAIDEQRALTEEKRHSDRYFLQYRFIPDLVDDVSKGEISVDDLMDKDWWECSIQLFNDMNFTFEWEELRCEKMKVNDNYEMVVYTFPVPKQTPDAAYGAVLINTANNDATYFTLEYTFGNRWMLCSTKQGTHRNYGTVENQGLEAFVAVVSEKANIA